MDWLMAKYPQLERKGVRQALMWIAILLPVCVVVMTVLVLWQEGGR